MNGSIVYTAHHHFLQTFSDPNNGIVIMKENGELTQQNAGNLANIIVSELFLKMIHHGTTTPSTQPPTPSPSLTKRPSCPQPPPPSLPLTKDPSQPPLTNTCTFWGLGFIDLENEIFPGINLSALFSMFCSRQDPEAFKFLFRTFMSEKSDFFEQSVVSLSSDLLCKGDWNVLIPARMNCCLTVNHDLGSKAMRHDEGHGVQSQSLKTLNSTGKRNGGQKEKTADVSLVYPLIQSNAKPVTPHP